MTSGKRARSPDGSPGDRPAKRLSLATGDVSIGCRHFGTSSINSNRYPSEDWVQQTGGLTINSPVFPLTTDHFPVQTPDVEMEMSMEPDDSGVQSLQTPLYPFHERRYLERTQAVVNMVPHTPIIFNVPPNKHENEEQHPPTRPSTPPNTSPNAMVLSSPATSFSQTPKRRVFFGPRTGCEKCKLGVKGHFIHSE